MIELGAVFDLSLALTIVMLALFSVRLRDGFAAVVVFMVYGLLLALAWVRLGAPDVALTEAAIGAGLTGVLLLSAVARLRPGEAAAETERPSATLNGVAAVLSAAVTGVLAVVVLGASEPAPTLAHEALANLPKTGVENPVTAVLMAFRATDTLLEKIVLVLAVLAVWSLAPDSKWGGRPGPKERIDPDGVLPFLARVLPPFGVVVGIYLVWVSSSEPGGAFQGSTLLAAMWLLVMMAGLVDAPATRRRRLRLAVLAGPVFFLAVGLAGYALAGAFLAYPIDWAKTLIVAIEVPMLLSLAAMLGMLVLGPPQRSEDE